MKRSTKPAPSEVAALDPAGHHSTELLDTLIERLLGDVALRHVAGRRVLYLGDAVEPIAGWVQSRAARFERVHEPVVLEGGPLPHDAASFDVVLCLRTVARMVEPADDLVAVPRRLFAEVSRVLAAGGVFLADFANPRSLRGAYYGVRNPKSVVEAGPWLAATDHGTTRFEPLGRFLQLLPRSMTLVDSHGIQVLVPAPEILAIPVLGRLLAALEWKVRDSRLLRHFGAHRLCVFRKLSALVPGQ